MAETKPKATSEANAPAARKSTTRRRTSAASPTGRKARSHPKRGGRGNGRSGMLAKGKSALNDAYEWAGQAGASMPRALRNMPMPDQRSIQSVMDEKPLLVGAVGLGIGVMIGALLPSFQGRSAPSRSPRGRR